MLEAIRKKANKISQTNNKYKIIAKILEDDNCFKKLDINTSLSILYNLGYNETQAREIYLQLIRK